MFDGLKHILQYVQTIIGWVTAIFIKHLDYFW